MERLSHRDLVGVAAFVLEGSQATAGVDEHIDRTLAGISRLVPCMYVSYNDVDFSALRSTTVEHPQVPLRHHRQDVLGRLILEHPGARPFVENPRIMKERSADHVFKISDFVTFRQFRETRIHNELYRLTGTRDQIGTIFVSAKRRIALALNRDRGGFTERDRVVLKLLRPHLVSMDENARAFADVRATVALLERGAESAGAPIVVLTEERRVVFATALAERLVDAYFGPRPADRLPDALDQWLGRTHLTADELLATPFESFVVDRDGRRLTVRVLREVEGFVVRLEETHLVYPVDVLIARGLTPREADVLRWVTEGKTNPEIAAILQLSPRTVQHALERVYRKLDVETRTSASAWALAAIQETTPGAARSRRAWNR